MARPKPKKSPPDLQNQPTSTIPRKTTPNQSTEKEKAAGCRSPDEPEDLLQAGDERYETWEPKQGMASRALPRLQDMACGRVHAQPSEFREFVFFKVAELKRKIPKEKPTGRFDL